MVRNGRGEIRSSALTRIDHDLFQSRFVDAELGDLDSFGASMLGTEVELTNRVVAPALLKYSDCNAPFVLCERCVMSLHQFCLVCEFG